MTYSLEWFYDTLSVAPWNTSTLSYMFCIACETQYVIYERSAYEVNRLHIVLDVSDIESNIDYSVIDTYAVERVHITSSRDSK